MKMETEMGKGKRRGRGRGRKLRAGTLPTRRAGPALPASLRRGLARPAATAAVAAAGRPGGSMAFIRRRRLEQELYSKER